MAAFVHTFAPPGAVARPARTILAPPAARGAGGLTCHWRRATDGRLVAAWRTTVKEAGEEPASMAFAAAA